METLPGAPWLTRAALRPGTDDGFPFDVPTLRGLDVALDASVTLLAGDNGTGKSTLLEALAIASNLPTLGRAAGAVDPTLAAQRRLADRLRLTWRRRTRRGFFLRAEDFFGYVRALRAERSNLREDLADLDRRMKGASAWARGLARGPLTSSIASVHGRYGGDLDDRSHGEAFLAVFRSRFAPNGLILLDEPEAALSPTGQLAFMGLIADMVRQGTQFIIATHSPMVLAIPDGAILSFDSAPPEFVAYDELDSVRLWRDFLAAPGRFLRHVWEPRPVGDEPET